MDLLELFWTPFRAIDYIWSVSLMILEPCSCDPRRWWLPHPMG